MATKLFKSLTMGGDTYKLDDYLGRGIFATKTVSIPTASTKTIGAEIDITEPGTYLLFGVVEGGLASSTSVRYIEAHLGFKFNGSSSYSFTTNSTVIPLSANAYSRIPVAYQYTFVESQIPAKVCIAVQSSQPTTGGYTSINAVKIVST